MKIGQQNTSLSLITTNMGIKLINYLIGSFRSTSLLNYKLSGILPPTNRRVKYVIYN